MDHTRRIQEQRRAMVDARWLAHPVAAGVLRLTVALLPVVGGLVAGGVVAHQLTRPVGVGLTVIWWVAVLSTTVLAVIVVERGARHLLPLSLLLRLALLFPDQAPNRFRTALRASTVRRAARRLDEADASGSLAQQAEAALALVAALHAHDRRTRGHSERVRALTVMVAQELGVEGRDLDHLEWAGLLHDIGKLRVPPHILNKAGPPDDVEWRVLQRHPGEGGVLTAPLSGWLGDWVHGVDQHHEYHDGSGYPLGLAGSEIALSGRIVAVTDALETMTAARSYKRPMPIAEAREELVACSGKQFDPEVVRAVLTLSLPRLCRVLGPLTAMLQVPLVAPLAGAAVDVHGVLASVLASVPRSAVTVALVLGTLSGAPATMPAGADPVPRGVGVRQPADAGDQGASGGHANGPGAGEGGQGHGRGAIARGGHASDGGGSAATGSSTTGGPDDPTGTAGRGTSDDPRLADAPAALPPPHPTTSTTSVPHHTPPPTSPPPTSPSPTSPPPSPSPPIVVPTIPPPTVPPVVHPDPPGLPADAQACLNGGWVALGFPNQGQCIAYMLHH